jgi:hypothetical protein
LAGEKWPGTDASQLSFSAKVEYRMMRGVVLLVMGLMVLPVAAQAQEQITALDRAAGPLNECIAEQTDAELSKRTAPRQFEIVLRDKCRKQAQRFKATLIAGFKKEGSFGPNTLRLVNELLTALREQSMVNYTDMLRKPGGLVNRLIGV